MAAGPSNKDSDMGANKGSYAPTPGAPLRNSDTPYSGPKALSAGALSTEEKGTGADRASGAA